jgi:arylformamidase
MSLQIIDISPLISSELAVFPGDTAFQNPFKMNFDQGSNFTLSQITSTVHLGAHADAPFHYHPNGKTIDQVDLDLYIGTCQVIEVNVPRGARIQINDFDFSEISEKRVLFKTKSFNPNQWCSDFNSLSPKVVVQLAGKGVLLVGIDTPSIDLADDKDLLSHRSVYESNMAVLEGLVLNHVNAGLYQLIALPLKIKDCEASPLRAVLLPLNAVCKTL